MGKLNTDEDLNHNNEEIELKARTNEEEEEFKVENCDRLIVNTTSNSSLSNSLKDNFRLQNGNGLDKQEENLNNNFNNHNEQLNNKDHQHLLINQAEEEDQQPELNSLNDHILSNDKLEVYLTQNEILTNSIKLFRSEFKRMNFNEKYWRYTSFNKNFTLCSTYPPFFIVPTQFNDDALVEVAKFRHIGRLPSVVYRHRNGAVIVCLFFFLLN